MGEKLDGLMGDLLNIRRVMGSFSTVKDRESSHDEYLSLLRHLLEDSLHRKLILDRMMEKLDRRFHQEGVGYGKPFITEGHKRYAPHDE